MNRVLSGEAAYDVVVVGGGLAGTMAAIAAGRQGARVGMVVSASLFSGSSFFPGTWGLGLVGPEDGRDVDDLVDTIGRVGCGMAIPSLVSSFVWGINAAVDFAESLGVSLRKPENAGEREFVPCFDHKHRRWRGLEREGYEIATRRELDRLGVEVHAGCDLVSLVKDGDRVVGTVLYDHGACRFFAVSAGSVVLATGGVGGMFARNLVGADVTGAAHACALEMGCSAINMEFIQIMPGIISPCRGVVFNEKMFRHMRLFTTHGQTPFPGRTDDEICDLLECRSGHGPFTSRLPSRAVDLAIDAAGADGIAAVYRGGSMAEFARTYYQWLESEKGVGPYDEMRIALFAHAANGGILIDEEGWTGVPGLFACGEVTGGMHGADRIGGLSSANGLVFGLRAGSAAARCSCRFVRRDAVEARVQFTAIADPAAAIRALRSTMSAACMVRRSGEGLSAALETVSEKKREIDARRRACDDASLVAQTMRVRCQLTSAQAILSAALARRESRGAHFRVDAPVEDVEQAQPNLVKMCEDGELRVLPMPLASSSISS